VTDEQTPKPRSRRLYILWAIALTLLLCLALFCWLVVVPVWQVRNAVECAEFVVTEEDGQRLVAELGGAERAARRLDSFIRLPSWATGIRDSDGISGPYYTSPRDKYIRLLSYCDEPGVHVLARLSNHPSEAMAKEARGMLEYIAYGVGVFPGRTSHAEPSSPGTGIDPSVEFANSGVRKQVRYVAAEALRKIKAAVISGPPPISAP
jgi:hypothetical protein